MGGTGDRRIRIAQRLKRWLSRGIDGSQSRPLRLSSPRRCRCRVWQQRDGSWWSDSSEPAGFLLRYPSERRRTILRIRGQRDERGGRFLREQQRQQLVCTAATRAATAAANAKQRV